MIIAVYCVLAARFAPGMNVTVLASSETVPVTREPPAAVSVTLEALSVLAIIASEKVAETAVFKETPVAAAAGAVLMTVGAVTSGAGAVTKFQLYDAIMALPAASFTSREIVATYGVLAVSSTVGVKVAVLPLTVTVPGTTTPSADARVTLAPLMLAELSASENVIAITALSATAVAALAGATLITLGGVTSTAVEVPVVVDSQDATSAVSATEIIRRIQLTRRRVPKEGCPRAPGKRGSETKCIVAQRIVG